MNRKQKIIVSIVGITIVILALVGITYAYFLTRINGNTNTKSIEVSTVDLKLEYNDGTVEILTKDNITPGDEIGSKDFTITNKGESKVTGYVIYLEDVTNTFTNTNDVVYTLTCTSSDSNNCNGVEEEIYPTNNKILVTNDIEPNVVHSYVLTIQYKETNTDQSVDMNKKITGKVNLYDAKSLNPYATGTKEENEKSLAYNIINNSVLNKNGTSLVGNPLTKVTEASKTVYAKDENNYPLKRTTTFDMTDKQNYYCIYGDDYDVDENTNQLKILNAKVGKYSDIYNNLTDMIIGNCSENNISINSDNVTGYDTLKMVTYTSSAITSTSFKYGLIDKKNNTTKGTENILSITKDDYGDTYYYRGDVKDNYLNYSGYCWRIVRIEGDGSVKLILADKEGLCTEETILKDDSAIIGFGTFGKDGNNKYLEGSMKSISDTFLMGGTIESINYSPMDITEIKTDIWCLGDLSSGYSTTDGHLLTEAEKTGTTYLYKTGENLMNKKIASLKCDNGTTYESKIATLTADEIAYAGGGVLQNNPSAYFASNSNTYALLSIHSWQSSSNYVQFFITENGGISQYVLNTSTNVRPAITLISDVKITDGDGTIEHPYNIDMN